MSDIDTAAVDSLKVLDPKRPIREADMLVAQQCPLAGDRKGDDDLLELICRPGGVLQLFSKPAGAGPRLVDLGGIAFTGSPADFTRLIAEETMKWAKVVKFSGAKAE